MRPDPLHLVGKLGNPQIARRVTEHASGHPAGPVIVELDPTSFCDLSCPNCVTQDVLNDGRFTAGRLRQLADEFRDAGVLGVILIGGGEPLVHPATVEVIDRLHRNDLRVGLVTNGTLVRRSAAVLAEKCDWVRVSVDAASAATHRRLRPGGTRRNAFAEVLDGLRALTAARPRQARVGYSFVVQQGTEGRPGNIAEIESAARLARSLGCDYIEYKAEMDFSHRVRTVADPDAPDGLADIERGLAAAESCGNASFGVHLSSSMRALLAGEPPQGQKKSYRHCAVSALRTTVSPAGCFVCSYHRGNDTFSYGDPTKESFAALWADRGARVRVDPSADCTFHCARHELNLELDSYDPSRRSPVVEDDVFL